MNRLFFLAIILVSGCTSLNKVECTLEKKPQTYEYTYSDPESKIRYNITNDDKNLHIRLNTAEFTTITKIFRTGLKICFDVKGKKSDKVYFEYPLPQSQPFSVQGGRRAENGQQTREPGQPGRFDLNRMIDQIPNEGELDRNGEKERILVMSTDSDVKVSIRAIHNDEIIYDLFIPLNRLSKAGFSSLSKLSIGIVSGKNEASSSGEGRPAGGGGGGRSGGMGGGGRSGGGRGGMGGGGGRYGGMSAQGGTGGMDRSSMFKPVEFWFKLSLLKVD